jgi:hypothetical protein
MLLPLIGAGLGGYTAYQKSGGNLGATLLGAGTGAFGARWSSYGWNRLGGHPSWCGWLGSIE